MSKVFGAEGESAENGGSKIGSHPGQVKFFEARLAAVPLRSSHSSFYYATSPQTLQDFFEAIKTFTSTDTSDISNWLDKLTFDDNAFLAYNPPEGLEIEDFLKHNKLIFGDNGSDVKSEMFSFLALKENQLAIFNEEEFKSICESSMPVIARNKIGDEGISENLFYEEVLPRRTVLWFMLAADEEHNEILELFVNDLVKENALFQFGANSSIGYGVCNIEKVNIADGRGGGK